MDGDRLASIEQAVTKEDLVNLFSVSAEEKIKQSGGEVLAVA